MYEMVNTLIPLTQAIFLLLRDPFFHNFSQFVIAENDRRSLHKIGCDDGVAGCSDNNFLPSLASCKDANTTNTTKDPTTTLKTRKSKIVKHFNN